MNLPWRIATDDGTSKLSGAIGHVNINVQLHNEFVTLSNLEIYSKFVRTVNMKPVLERIPKDKIRNRYWNCFWMKLRREVIVLRNLKHLGG